MGDLAFAADFAFAVGTGFGFGAAFAFDFAFDFAFVAVFGGNVSANANDRRSQSRNTRGSSITSSASRIVSDMTRPFPIGSNGAEPSSFMASC